MALTGFFALGRAGTPQARQAAAWWLALASLFFYGWWDVRYVVLLLLSICSNFLAGRALSAGVATCPLMRAKKILFAAVGINLATLGYYKYAEFFTHNLSSLTGLDFAISGVILPLGISFFTFTQIAFLVDCYQGKVQETRFAHYLLFVTYFPHLIAGPVLHHADMMPQFARPETYRPQANKIAAGVMLFSLGLFKKVIVADGIVQYSSPVFNAVAAGYEPSFWEANSAAFSYTLQLYFDFSGYSDMAVGLSWLFGIQLPINFNSPCKATNLIDFWRRWHISLSTFLRDYLYIPLGGNQRGTARRYANLGATMLLGGLWHGAAWTFVIWGALHGVGLMLNHAWLETRNRWGIPAMPRLITVPMTFYVVMLLWVFFRAADVPTAMTIIKAMWGIQGWDQTNSHAVVSLSWVLFPCLVVFFAPNSQALVERASRWLSNSKTKGWRLWMLSGGFAWAFWWAFSRINRVSEFLYFQF